MYDNISPTPEIVKAALGLEGTKVENFCLGIPYFCEPVIHPPDYEYMQVRISSLHWEQFKKGQELAQLFQWWFEIYLPSQGWKHYESVDSCSLHQTRRFRRQT